MSFQREEFLKKKRKKRLKWFFIVLVILIFIIGILAFISHRKEFRISKIELSGGVLVLQNDVEREAKEFLKGSYIWLFPKDNSLIYSKEALENFLKNKFQRIENIKISLKNPQTLVVSINERKPDSLWCDSFPSLSGEYIGNCYFMDDNGTIFAGAPYFSGDAYFKYYGLISSTSPVIGKEYFSPKENFKSLTKFVSDMKNLALHPVYMIYSDNDEFTAFMGSGAKIIFNAKDSFEKTSSNLKTLLQSNVFASTSDPISKIDYIDLRFGNKLFYKLKDSQ